MEYNFKRGDTVQALKYRRKYNSGGNYTRGFIRLISNQRINTVWISLDNQGEIFNCSLTTMMTTRMVLVEKRKNIKEPVWIEEQIEDIYENI